MAYKQPGSIASGKFHNDIDQLRRQAKELLKRFRKNDAEAIETIAMHFKNATPNNFNLAQALLVLARTHGFPSWQKLRDSIIHEDKNAPKALLTNRRVLHHQNEALEELCKHCENGQIENAQRILSKYPDLLKRTLDYKTPLHFAAISGNIELVQILLDLGANPNPGEERYIGVNTLEHAKTRGLNEIAELLENEINKKYQPDDILKKMDFKKFFELNDEKVLNEWKTYPPSVHGSDPNAAESVCHGYGHAVFASSLNGDTKTLKLLLEHGANPSSLVDSSGDALWRTKSDEVKELLISYGAKPSIVDYVCDEKVEMVESLLQTYPGEANQALHIQSVSGPEHEKNYLRMLTAAFEHGADPKEVKEFCLYLAIENMPPVAEFLFSKGASPNIVFTQYCLKGQKDKIDYLLEKGANINHRGGQFNATALAEVSRKGNVEIVKYLLEKGANKTLGDENPISSPLQWAIREGHHELVELLSIQA